MEAEAIERALAIAARNKLTKEGKEKVCACAVCACVRECLHLRTRAALAMLCQRALKCPVRGNFLFLKWRVRRGCNAVRPLKESGRWRVSSAGAVCV